MLLFIELFCQNMCENVGVYMHVHTYMDILCIYTHTHTHTFFKCVGVQEGSQKIPQENVMEWSVLVAFIPPLK